MEKKKEKKVKSNIGKMKVKTTEQIELKNFLIVILVVLVCVLGLYFMTRAFVTKDLFGNDETEEKEVAGTVNYDVAIMGQLLNRPYSEYYVIIYDAGGEYMYDMSSLVSSYKALEKHKHIYTIDLGNELNASYYSPEEVNTKAKSLEEIKLGDTTLIKVKDGKINKYIVDYEKMKSELGV